MLAKSSSQKAFVYEVLILLCAPEQDLSPTLPCLASFDHNSLSETQPTEAGNKSACPLRGKLVCMNIMQEFIDFDKKQFLDKLGNEIKESILSGEALEDPERHLSRFGLLVYADLKKYNFYYWFSFPAINYPENVNQRLAPNHDESKGRSITEYFSYEQSKRIQEEYDKPYRERGFQRGYFIIVLEDDAQNVKCLPLTSYKQYADRDGCSIFCAFTDPSANQEHPGWPMRNFLALLSVQFGLKHIKILRIRRGQPNLHSKLDIHLSRVVEIVCDIVDGNSILKREVLWQPLVTGWEKNEAQQMAPKRVNLSNLLDPKRLADDAVNLNLRLMKWRLLPGLDLDRIANTKCLLLGCGTLGCHIARGLLAWGIKSISLVDNSKISYSNPVRQSLYTFEDCVQAGQGVYKVEVAAASLRRIHPMINVNAHVLSIPMPGHHIAENEVDQTKKDVERLESLIENHDVTFLLMDTRESRWLPTVIAMSKQKLVINAAIGFDTFLLQRYGSRNYSDLLTEVPSTSTGRTIPSKMSSDSCSAKSDAVHLASDKLGCYFCNDIVAPGDSTLDRTLDQQCTVSRPGVSMMVSAMAVELLASIVSSELGPKTPAPIEVNNDLSLLNEEDLGSELGIVPHSIRGNLNRYHIYMPTSPSFNKCSACSVAVIKAYRESGYEFLHRVFEDPSYLEEVAGLKDLQNVSDDVWALESDEIFLDDTSQ